MNPMPILLVLMLVGGLAFLVYCFASIGILTFKMSRTRDRMLRKSPQWQQDMLHDHR